MSTTTINLNGLHEGFLSMLPRLRGHGRVYFRHLNNPERKEEAIAEMIALSWKWYCRLAERGKDGRQFVSAIASYAARAVNSGRHMCGTEKAKDVMSPVAQRRHGFTVESLPNTSTLGGNPYDEALHDNIQTPVPEQVSFRCDFPAWLRTRTHRDRGIIENMMVGQRTLDLANKFGISPARISQLRREYQGDWQRFTDDQSEGITGAPAVA